MALLFTGKLTHQGEEELDPPLIPISPIENVEGIPLKFDVGSKIFVVCSREKSC